MKPKQKRNRSNEDIYWTVIIVFFTLGAGTFLHDPVLHGMIAYFNGWSIDDYQTGLMIGSTSVIAPANAPWYSYWAFFMFPSFAIFFIIAVMTFIKPERSVMVGGIIAMSLNLPSMNPMISGSDAYNAVGMLVKKGFPEAYAYVLHFLIFIGVVAVWAIYLYVTIENDPKDSRNRIENIYH